MTGYGMVKEVADLALSEQEFYDRLAIFFDVMTDWPSRLAYEMPFLQRVLGQSQGQRVLDAACGTGWHSIALARAGYQATGADISPVMVARAVENARRENVPASFVPAAFQDLPQAAGGGFDAVLCLGNSLVHVLDENSLRQSLSAMAACLKPDGLLVLHNLNYDKRMGDKPRWFQVSSGVMDGQETLVWRFADYNDSMVTFHFSVFQKEADGRWTVQVHSTPQRPWQSADLVQLLGDAGFQDVKLFGNLAGDAYGPQTSGDLVIVAKRRD
jgi:glycine/sarcosine N-methyltransferase